MSTWKKGDEAAIIQDAQVRCIVRIEGLTPTGLIRAGGALWNRDGGRRAWTGTYGRPSLVPVTDEHRLIVERDLLCQRIRNADRKLFERIDLPTLRRVVALLDGKTERAPVSVVLSCETSST